MIFLIGLTITVYTILMVYILGKLNSPTAQRFINYKKHGSDKSMEQRQKQYEHILSAR
ncbi:hypothetical protein SAMN05421743_106171 [Thalassobacillus cyri]|uniref:Uncharacterized protein n=1 Tax=Thalassobacillus cyri TaxID=571932 RepID=A0A1H4CSA6_9BACI|nr:hypothetical protein [Thalassobacillus cyri]SEA63303.1 hypothetical protein SAMN05421743_106171 [Thalassobacillus cyri]